MEQCVIQHPKNINPAPYFQENAITLFMSRLNNSLLKYLRNTRSVKNTWPNMAYVARLTVTTEKFKFKQDKFLELKCPTMSPRQEQTVFLISHPIVGLNKKTTAAVEWPRKRLHCFETAPNIPSKPQCNCS